MLKLMTKTMQANAFAHAGALALTFGGFQWVKGKLDASYAASNHPVDYATGQTAFSGPVTKGYYAYMQEAGTLDIYWQTQLIDFGFIAAMFALGLLLSTMVGRFAPEGSWGRKAALLAGLMVMSGALCDACENLISFVMLANPQGFADWIALPYSAFAAVKFALIAGGMLTLILALLLTAVAAVRRRFA